MFLHKSDTANYTVICPLSFWVFAIMIMQFLRAIDTGPNQKILFLKEAAPFVINQCRIGLKRIRDPFITGIFLLQFHRPAKKINSQQCRLSPCHAKQTSGTSCAAMY